jgi:hypothetical protein
MIAPSRVGFSGPVGNSRAQSMAGPAEPSLSAATAGAYRLG